MEVIEEKKISNKTLTTVSPIDDDTHTVLKPNSEDSVVVTTTVVETTEINIIQQEEGEHNESIENEKEGLFGNLVGEDEGMKVNCSENGTSLDMDVDASSAGQNGTYENPASEEKSGFLAVKHDEIPSGDPMDICSSGGNAKNSDNNAGIIESQDDMNKIDDTSVKNGEDEEEEENHSFVVGDYVWGKIKSHPWWPGQIYDPSDASDYASALKHKGQLLVAYFGDGSFSWCSPSQLKPFIDHFQEMSSQSNSKKFVNAVQNVLEDVSRLVETELTCKCQPVNINENEKKKENAGVVNRGIKEGARAPKGNTLKVLMDRIEPVELVSTLKGYATMELGTRLVDLELTVLKSCLSAFYTTKGGYVLVEYHDPMCIEGLEEETETEAVTNADSDIIGPSGSPDNGDDKLYQTRKQKSVAELLGEDDSKIKKAKSSKNGGMKVRKRKPLVVSVPSDTDQESGGGGGSGGGFEEETISPRERKKSRYLSPPYLSPVGIGSGKLSGFGSGSFKEPKPESEKVPEIAAKQLEDSLKSSSGKKTRRAREASDSQGPKKKTDADLNATVVFNGLLRAALDPTSYVDKNLPELTTFVLSFRSNIFTEGARDQTDEKEEGEDTSELALIKQKLEWMSEMVHTCEEREMNADVKASLEGGIQEVLEKVAKLRKK